MKKITNIIVIVLFSYNTSLLAQTCDSATTLFAPTPNLVNNGMMFDITAMNAVIIKGFDISPFYSHAKDTFEIYYKVGTYQGYVQNSAAWTLAKSYTLATTKDSTKLPQDISIIIPAGQTYGFYLTFRSNYNFQQYTTGYNVGNWAGGTTDISVLEGALVNYPFGAPSVFLPAGYKEPRIWNGRVHYCVVIQIVNSMMVNCYGGNNGTATIATNGLPPYTYSWSTTPIQTTQTATGLAAGNYTVTGTDANSLTATASVIITQPLALTTSMSITNTSSCSVNNGSLTANVLGGTVPYTYAWSNAQTAKITTGLSAGTYTVTITDANGCSITSPTATITVPPNPPTPTITQLGNALASSSNTGNQWYLNGNIISSANGQFYTPTQNGNYTVIVTDGNGCSSSSTTFNFTVSDIIENNFNNYFFVSPNPTNGIFSIKSEHKILSIEIVNIFGEKTYSSQLNSPQSEIDLSNQPNGIYFMQIKTEQGIATKKLIINK